MKTRRICTFIAATCIGVLAGSGALAEDLVYFDEDGGGAGPRGLYDVDSVSGTQSLRTTVGGSDRFFSMTRDPDSGDVYAIDPLSKKLVTIDIDTGAITTLGNVTGTSTPADITFDSAGTMWALERNAPLNLYTIDLNTLAASFVGTLSSARTGLTWLGGTLYAFGLDGTLYEVDPNTGVDTLIGGGGGPTLVEDATGGADGMLYVTNWSGSLYQVDPSTGVNTLVLNTNNGTGCLGIIGEPTVNCLTMAVSTLTADQQGTWDISGADANSKGVVVYGTALGSTVVNGFGGYCASFWINGVNQNKVVGFWSADGNGDAQVNRQIPGNVAGLTVHTQAAQQGTCPDECVSNIDTQTIL